LIRTSCDNDNVVLVAFDVAEMLPTKPLLFNDVADVADVADVEAIIKP
jgi:hypothetical protein